MPAAKSNPRLKNLDDLFRLSGEPDPMERTPGEVAQDIPVKKNSGDTEYAVILFTLMDDYPGHPFRLYTGQRKDDMIESIRANGILQPLILRPVEENRYQILSGHNRKHNAMAVGLTESPSIIKHNLSDDEAWAYVIETNLIQRSFSDMAHSEKAAVLALYHSKLFSQGKRNDIMKELQMLENPHGSNENSTCAQTAQKLKSRDIVAQEYGLSKDTVARYLRINKLIPSLKTCLDNDIIGFIPAVTLSFLTKNEQESLFRHIELNKFKVDIDKADRLRQFSKEGKLTDENAYLILSGEVGKKPKPNRTPTVKVNKAVYAKYFSPNQSAKEVQDVVEKALALYFDSTQSK